jgi:AGZA family xanthine/uracil permease-like MFS transporter
MFLSIIAFRNAGIIVDSPATSVQLGDLGTLSPLLSAFCCFAMDAMDRLCVPAANLIFIITVTNLLALIGLNTFSGNVYAPPSLSPTFMQLDISSAFEHRLISVVFAFLFVDPFDTASTLIGVTHRTGHLDENGRIPRLRSALLAVSLATVAGAARRRRQAISR